MCDSAFSGFKFANVFYSCLKFNLKQLALSNQLPKIIMSMH
uniref:Uncharacterized protein n=1 Tax=Arundo donax TaxID=35708 RepID=A0A0A8ZY58_ARUDO